MRATAKRRRASAVPAEGSSPIQSRDIMFMSSGNLHRTSLHGY